MIFFSIVFYGYFVYTVCVSTVYSIFPAASLLPVVLFLLYFGLLWYRLFIADYNNFKFIFDPTSFPFVYLYSF